jgi:type IV pilus assembly protein PilW
MTVRSPRSLGRLARGISLVELMVAMGLSLVLLAGVLTMFASSRSTYETTDRLSRIQETGRFALDTIVRDLRSAGYIGCARSAELQNNLNDSNSVLWNFARPVEGFDAQGVNWVPTLDTGIVPSPAPGNDVLVVRLPAHDFEPIRVTSEMTAETDDVVISADDADRINVNDIVMISDCEGRAVFEVTSNAGGVLGHAVSGGSEEGESEESEAGKSTPGNSTDSLGFVAARRAELVRYQTVIYYIRESQTPDVGTSLWRRVSGSANAEELVEGVERMQVLFRTRGSSDFRTAAQINAAGDWDNVVSVRVALLVRSLSEYGTDTDQGTYQVLDQTVATPGDRHMRQVFTTTVTIRNVTD